MAKAPDPPPPTSRSRRFRGLAREQIREATRERIMEAATDLFSRHGWQGTHLRDVAAAADATTGAVFSNFSDKADLFFATLEQDFTGLAVAFTEAARRPGKVEDSLLAIFMAGYRHYDAKLPMLRSLQELLWSEKGDRLCKVLAQPNLRQMFERRLQKAEASGEMTGDAVEMRTEMLEDLYYGNFLYARLHGWDLTQLERRARAQIAVVVEAARPREGAGS